MTFRPRRSAGAGSLLLSGLLLATACGTGGGSPYPERVTLPSLEEAYLLPTESCGHFFIAQVMLNGEGPYDFLLDSGAGQTMVSPHVVREAGLGQRIDSLSVGEFRAFELGYDDLDMRELSAALGRRVYGILGHPVFAGTLMTWDFPAGTIELQVGELPASAEDVVAARDDRRPFVRSRVGGTARWVLIDTGSSRGLTLRRPEQLPLASPLETTGARARVDGIHLVHTGRIRGLSQIGLLQIEDPVVSNSVSVDLVGQEVLRFFRITFDQQNDRVRFEREDAPVSTPVGSSAVQTLGYAIRPDSAWAEVIHVFRDGTPVRKGDRILEVNGTAWADRTCPVRRGGPAIDPVADTVEVLVDRDGEQLRLAAPRWVAHSRRTPGESDR